MGLGLHMQIGFGGIGKLGLIAAEVMAEKYDVTGYDLFASVMLSREKQAENVAKRLVSLAVEHDLEEIWIHGKAFKPNVQYIEGSYSLLVGHFVEELGYQVRYVDLLTDDVHSSIHGVILMAHHAPTTYGNTQVEHAKSQSFYCEIQPGSVILDPWRYLRQSELPGCLVVHYGNTRGRN